MINHNYLLLYVYGFLLGSGVMTWWNIYSALKFKKLIKIYSDALMNKSDSVFTGKQQEYTGTGGTSFSFEGGGTLGAPDWKNAKFSGEPSAGFSGDISKYVPPIDGDYQREDGSKFEVKNGKIINDKCKDIILKDGESVRILNEKGIIFAFFSMADNGLSSTTGCGG